MSGFMSYVVRAPAGQVSLIIGLMARVDVWPTGPVGNVIWVHHALTSITTI